MGRALYAPPGLSAFADATLTFLRLSTATWHKHVDKLCMTANNCAKSLFYKTRFYLHIF